MSLIDTAGWLPVSSHRYSICGSEKLENLNWRDWWLDTSFGYRYLHVASKDGETRHRVCCKQSKCPRIGFSRGKLYWLVDPKETKK